MRLNIEILKNGVIYCYNFLYRTNHQRILFDNEFIIDLFKVHDHRYFYKAFFYNTKNIYYSKDYNTKWKFYTAVQDLLKEELYDVIHF